MVMVYQGTFLFPKKPKNQFSLKEIATSKSYPMSSTNSTRLHSVVTTRFISHDDNGCSRPSKPETKQSSFKARNKFIIARNFLGKLVTGEERQFNKVSKATASVSVHNSIGYIIILTTDLERKPRCI